MKFSEKLKKLRQDNKLTQDELAEKIFVTRTAISKWETDKGYPSLESLRIISKLFNVTIDELISEEDLKNKKIMDNKKSKKMYILAMISFVLTFLFACCVPKNKYFVIPTFLCMVAFLILSVLMKSSTIAENKDMKKQIIIRIIVSCIIAIVTFVILTFEVV